MSSAEEPTAPTGGKRKPYQCKLCGKPKKGHICPVKLRHTASAEEKNPATPFLQQSSATQFQPFEYYIVLDLEATCDRDHNFGFYPQEIIEWSCVLVHSVSRTMRDEFQRYIRPTVNPTLTTFCTELTGIQQAWVDAADTLDKVLEQFDLVLSVFLFLRNICEPTLHCAVDGTAPIHLVIPLKIVRICHMDRLGSQCHA